MTADKGKLPGVLSQDHLAAALFTDQSRVTGVRYVFEATEIPGLSVLCPSIGFQVVGLGQDPGKDGVILFHYFAPAAVRAYLGGNDQGQTEFRREKGGWIGKVYLPGDTEEMVRLFPTITPGSGAARAQGGFVHNGILHFFSNGATNLIYRAQWDNTATKPGWRLIDPLELEEDQTTTEPFGSKPGYIEAAVPGNNNELYVLRSRQDGYPVWLEAYGIYNGKRMANEGIAPHLLPPEESWVYGIGKAEHPKSGDLLLYYTTDPRATGKTGIYRGRTNIFPGVSANGIVILGGGEILLSQYNHDVGDFGTGCSILRVDPLPLEKMYGDPPMR